VLAAQQPVLHQVEVHHQSLFLPVLGNVGDAALDAVPPGALRDVRPLEADGPRLRDAHAGDGLDEFLLAVAVDAGDAEHLAGPDLEGDVGDRLDAALVGYPEVLDRERHVAGSRRWRFDLQEDLPADHQLREFLPRRRRGLDGADVLAVAQDRDFVRGSHRLTQLVGDEDNRLPLGGQLLQHRKEVCHLLGGEDGRRLVEDKDVCTAVEGLQDFDALLDADRDVLDGGVGVDVEPVPLAQLDHLRAGLFAVDHEAAEATRLVAQRDVLGDGHRVDQHEVLVDHPHAGVDGIPWGVERPGYTIDHDLAGGRLVEPVEDVHQRRLPGPVLTEQRVDGPPLDGQVHVVVRDDTRESLRDPPHLDCRLAHCHVLTQPTK